MANDGKTDTQIIETLGTARNTIRTVRYRYVHQGLESAINEQPRPGAPSKIYWTGQSKDYCDSMLKTSRGTKPLDIASYS